jgi:hypothetical protein
MQMQTTVSVTMPQKPLIRGPRLMAEMAKTNALAHQATITAKKNNHGRSKMCHWQRLAIKWKQSAPIKTQAKERGPSQFAATSVFVRIF